MIDCQCILKQPGSFSRFVKCKDWCHRRNDSPFVFQNCKRRNTKCRIQSHKREMYIIPQCLRLAEALMPIYFSYCKYKLQGVGLFFKLVNFDICYLKAILKLGNIKCKELDEISGHLQQIAMPPTNWTRCRWL